MGNSSSKTIELVWMTWDVLGRMVTPLQQLQMQSGEQASSVWIGVLASECELAIVTEGNEYTGSSSMQGMQDITSR